VISYFFMVAVVGWHPDVEHRRGATLPAAPSTGVMK
jgi:hypothetical protein